MIDISWPISPSMTAYKDKKTVAFVETTSFSCSAARESLIRFSSHTGTHMDAPSHMLEDGATSESLKPIIGPCQVVDLSLAEEVIKVDDLKGLEFEKGSSVLFKTRNSSQAQDAAFDLSFVYLSQEAAQVLVDAGVSCVGIDALGIERGNKEHETHKVLMNNGVTIVEGLRLAHVEAGQYTFICMPLSLVGLDGAPARAVLVKN